MVSGSERATLGGDILLRCVRQACKRAPWVGSYSVGLSLKRHPGWGSSPYVAFQALQGPPCEAACFVYQCVRH